MDFTHPLAIGVPLGPGGAPPPPPFLGAGGIMGDVGAEPVGVTPGIGVFVGVAGGIGVLVEVGALVGGKVGF